MMVIADIQCSVAQLALVPFKELNVKTIWSCPDSIFIGATPILIYFSKMANWNRITCSQRWYVYASCLNNLANSHSSRMTDS